MTQWTTGPTGVVRTGETSLADDELVVCDVLFHAPAVEDLLLKHDIRETFNLPFDGGLQVGAVAERLSKMEADGLLEVCDSNGGRTIGLTDLGGSLWEAERRPPWDAYCADEEGTLNGVATLESWPFTSAWPSWCSMRAKRPACGGAERHRRRCASTKEAN